MDIGNLVYSFFNGAGPGGVVVIAILLGACVVYYRVTRWIIAGGQARGGYVRGGRTGGGYNRENS